MITLANFTLNLEALVVQLTRIADRLDELAERQRPPIPGEPRRATVRVIDSIGERPKPQRTDSRAEAFQDR